jgi:predicted DNA-binding antitoxin AbrB/MazE fold protein
MSITVEAVYEDGVLKPVRALPLVERQKVEITVKAVRVNASKSSFIIATPLIGTSVQAYDSYGCHPSSGESHGRYFSRGLD